MLCKIRSYVHAACILPFSAGLIKVRRNGGYSVHDGSIAGVVMLTTSVIIILEVIFVLPVQKSRSLMISFLALGIASLLFCSLKASRPNMTVLHGRTPSDRMKLVFLWLFCIGTMTYEIISLSANVVCRIQEIDVFVFCGFKWSYYIIQTVFIHYFSSYIFANTLVLYYGLLVLFITNISMWAQRIIYSFVKHNMHGIPHHFANYSNNETDCTHSPTLFKVADRLESYLEPMSLEYCLLSLVFISEMWPKRNITVVESRHLYESASFENSEHVPLLPNVQNSLDSMNYMWNKKSSCVLAVTLLYILCYVMIEIVFMAVDEAKHYKFVLYVTFCVGNFLRVLVTIRCFYAFLGELQPKLQTTKWINLDNILILISSFASCGFIVIGLLQYNWGGQTTYVINSVFRVFAIFFTNSFYTSNENV